jgi:hypothetical protein
MRPPVWILIKALARPPVPSMLSVGAPGCIAAQ